MPRPQATPEQRAELRRRIQRAAAELYTQQGITSITARAVAKGAGVSVGTIYAHFKGLPELMRSLWTSHVERFEDRLRAMSASEGNPLIRIRALMTAYLDFGIENADLYKGVFMFVRPEGLEPAETAAFESAAIADLLTEAVAEGQAKGLLVAGPPREIAHFLWSGLHGCLALPINFDGFAPATTVDSREATIARLIRAIQINT